MSIDLNLFNYWQLCYIFNETNNDVQIFYELGRIAMISILQRTVTTIHDWQHAYRPCLLIPETHGVHYIKYRSTLSLLLQGHDTTAGGLQGYHLPSNQCFSTDMAY